jgi:geranylgeranyl pyrophosphate synthase
MSIDEISSSEIKQTIEKKGAAVVRSFGAAIFSGIKNRRIKTIFEDVKSLYKDNYRPALIATSCEAVGGDPEDTYEIGLMVTLAGAGIGIHDDMIDKSSFKHFRNTIPGKYDHDYALVIGDLLIVKGLTSIKEIFRNGCSSIKIRRLLETYQNFFNEVCDGVFLEKKFIGNIDINTDSFHQILWKLGSDAQACTKLGAILGNGTNNEIKILSNFGRRLGYVFRLSEEVNDTLNKEGNLSKRLKYETVPLPILHAAQFSQENHRIIKQILQNPITSEEIKTLLKLCFEAKSFEYVSIEAEKMKEEALTMLAQLRKNEAVILLSLMIKDMYWSIKNAFSTYI